MAHFHAQCVAARFDGRPCGLDRGVDDRAVSARLAAAGVEAAPLSAYRIERGGPGALLLGFAPYDERAIAAGVRTIASTL